MLQNTSPEFLPSMLRNNYQILLTNNSKTLALDKMITKRNNLIHFKVVQLGLHPKTCKLYPT